jgi:hypothetical protein
MSEMLSPHFSLAELIASDTAARLGIDNTPPADVLETLKHTATGLEAVRVLLGAPLHVSSGYRSPALNKLVGGQPSSQHTKGEAVDFTARQFGTPEQIVGRLVASGLTYDQVIVEFGRWVHISFSNKQRRQALVIDKAGVWPWQ